MQYQVIPEVLGSHSTYSPNMNRAKNLNRSGSGTKISPCLTKGAIEIEPLVEALTSTSRSGVCLTPFGEMKVDAREEICSNKEDVSLQIHAESAVVVDDFGDRGLYSGDLFQGEPHGHGKMTYDDGRLYEGCWDHGKYHGQGSTFFPTGDRYTGAYKHDLMHGQGTYRWEDGRTYVGQFWDDQRQGHGSYSWPDGSQYTGSFMAGKMHGHGTYTYHCGAKYDGEFLYGQRDGHGILTYANGQRYEGRFQLGHWHGQGTYSHCDGSLQRKGMWIRGEPALECSSQDIERS